MEQEQIQSLLQEFLDVFEQKQNAIIDESLDGELTMELFTKIIGQTNRMLMATMYEAMTKLMRNWEFDQIVEKKLEFLRKENSFAKKEEMNIKNAIEDLFWEVDQIKMQKPEKIQKFDFKQRKIRERNFVKLNGKYHQQGEMSEEKWKANKWGECGENENFHTKARCPKYGLHLWVHHTKGKDGIQPYDRGFKVVKDYRFKYNNGNHWPLRIELIPKRDKKRNTKGFIVASNEFGKEEWYSSFYNRFKSKGMIFDSYEEVLKANKDGMWKEHPLRKQFVDGKLDSVPLRINLSKEGWISCRKSECFKETEITRRVGKQYSQTALASEIIFRADKDGFYKITLNDIRKYRMSNTIEKVYQELDLEFNNLN